MTVLREDPESRLGEEEDSEASSLLDVNILPSSSVSATVRQVLPLTTSTQHTYIVGDVHQASYSSDFR
jgi:hypothetical protein